jgi:hypothetical protein
MKASYTEIGRMSTTKRPLPPLTEFEKNRDLFTVEQLQPYDGQWVAFSMDGKRIVAAAPDLLELDQRVVAAGENPENVALQFIDLNPEISPGGVQFG